MKKQAICAVASAAAVSLAMTGCSSAGQEGGGANTSSDSISMWTHNAGNPDELAVVETIVDAWNAANTTQVVIEAFPQKSYNDAIVAAASSGDLPCILDLDAPIMPNWAWAGYLAPLDVSKELTDSMLPSVVGIYQDEIYSLGAYDTAVGYLARASALEDAGVRVPTVDEPWTKDEFMSVLDSLKGLDGFEYPVDMSVWDTAEWWSYAYAPFQQSFGGDLIDRETYLSADGVINGPESVAFGEWFQGLFDDGYASRTPTEGSQDFLQGKVPLVLTGGWNVLAAVEEFGEDEVLILPPVDFGNGAKTGAGSWQWGVSSNCGNQEVANDFIEFLMQDEYLVAYSDALGNFPATQAATDASKHFGEGGVLRPLAEISREFAMIRPVTPGYAVISSVYDKALHDIMAGADVQAAFDQAAKDIDANITANDGYGFN